MPYGELFHGHTMAMVCRHRWWPVSNWGPPRENHSCSHSTWLLSFALSLPRSCPHYSLVQSPSLLLFLSYSSRFSFSLLITSDTRIRSFLFSLSNPHVDTIYLPFNIVSAIRFISQYSYLSVFPSFSHRISLPAPSVSLPSLSLSLSHLSTISVLLDIKPQIHPFSFVRVHPHKVLFVLCPRISQSRLLSSFFSFRRLSIFLLLPLPSHLPYVSTYYLREFPHRTNRPIISLAFHKSQPISDERFLLWIFKSFLCVHTFSTCTYEVLYRAQQYVVCAPVRVSYEKSLVCIFYSYISVCTNRVNDNFLQSGLKNLFNWQFKRYIRFNGFMEVINGNLIYLSWNNWILFTYIVRSW